MEFENALLNYIEREIIKLKPQIEKDAAAGHKDLFANRIGKLSALLGVANRFGLKLKGK